MKSVILVSQIDLSPAPQPRPPRRDQLTHDVDEVSSQGEPRSTATESSARTEPDASGQGNGWFSNTGSLILFGLALAVAAFVMARSWRRNRGRKSLESQVGEVRSWADAQLSESSSPLIGAPAELRKWHVEIEQIVRDARADLDTKIALLQAVVRSAAVESARLERAIEAARQIKERDQ